MSETISMNIEQCSTCRYWLRNYVQKPDGEPEPQDNGACRRRAPLPVMTQWVGQPGQVLAAPGTPPAVIYSAQHFGSMFPTMMEIGWCGDWEAKPSMNA